MSNNLKILLGVLGIVFLLVPSHTHAFIGTGIFDYFDSALSGIEEEAAPVINKILSFIFTYAIGFIALMLSGSLLESAMDPRWVNVTDSFVKTGWGFTVGISNMLIIIILVIIAFGFILKLENLQMKKTLPRLLGVALFMNFSLVFMRIFIDASNIFYNTFFVGNESIPNLLVSKLFEGTLQSMDALITMVVGAAVGLIVPFTAPFIQLGMVLLLGTGFLHEMIIVVLQTIVLYVMSGVFLTYALLFAARAIVIKLLAVLAPLAFLSMILPQTKKYWDKWFHLLLEWVFLGLPLIFFLFLALKSVNVFLPGTNYGTGYGGDTMFQYQNDPYVTYYIFLALYLVIVAFMSKKSMPQFAQAIIDQATGLGKMAWGRGVVPVSKGAADRLNRFAVSQKQKEDEINAKRDSSGNPIKLHGMQGLSMGLGKWARKGVEIGNRVAGTSPTVSVEKAIKEKEEKLKKRYGNDWEAASGLLNEGLTKGKIGRHIRLGGAVDSISQAALGRYLKGADGGKGLGKLSPERLGMVLKSVAKESPDDLKGMLSNMPELSTLKGVQKKFGREEGGKIWNTISETLVSDNLSRDEVTLKYKDKDVQRMAERGVAKEELLEKALRKKIFDGLKTADIDNLDSGLAIDKDFIEGIAREKNDKNYLQRIFEKFGPKFIHDVQEIANKSEVDFDIIAETNPSLIKLRGSQFGRTFMEDWNPPPPAPGGPSKFNPASPDYERDIKQAVNDAVKNAKSWTPIVGLPEVSPSMTDADKHNFANYAEGKSVLPDKINLNSLRDINGAINAVSYRIKDSIDNINKLVADQSAAAAPLKAAMQAQIDQQEALRDDFITRNSDFNIKKTKMETELARRKVSP